jgi:hypothetical protein
LCDLCERLASAELRVKSSSVMLSALATALMHSLYAVL